MSKFILETFELLCSVVIGLVCTCKCMWLNQLSRRCFPIANCIYYNKSDLLIYYEKKSIKMTVHGFFSRLLVSTRPLHQAHSRWIGHSSASWHAPWRNSFPFSLHLSYRADPMQTSAILWLNHKLWLVCNDMHIRFVAVHRGVMMADTLSFNAKIGVVNFWV